METEEDKKIAKLLKKMRAKPQFGLGQVPPKKGPLSQGLKLPPKQVKKV